MSQEWAATTPDQRTFGAQIGRLLDDLNKPDLSGQAQSYLQDAARYFQRKPFFFNESDNSAVPGWGQTSVGGAVVGNLQWVVGPVGDIWRRNLCDSSHGRLAVKLHDSDVGYEQHWTERRRYVRLYADPAIRRAIILRRQSVRWDDWNDYGFR